MYVNVAARAHVDILTIIQVEQMELKFAMPLGVLPLKTIKKERDGQRNSRKKRFGALKEVKQSRVINVTNRFHVNNRNMLISFEVYGLFLVRCSFASVITASFFNVTFPIMDNYYANIRHSKRTQREPNKLAAYIFYTFKKTVQMLVL